MERSELKYGKCELCEQQKHLLLVSFTENISYIIERKQSTYTGFFCKVCIKKIFYRATRRTLFGTWWGLMGGILGPGIIINNISEFIKSKRVLSEL